MFRPRRAALLLSALALSATLGGPAAQAQSTPPAPGIGALLATYERAREAVVTLEVKAIEGARSSASLGQQRTGSGVVIGADGLTLTIGYLVLEADEVMLTTADGQRHPARVVAYDLATGLGLVRPLLPLARPAPVAVTGTAARLKPGEALTVITGDGDVSPTRFVGRRPFSGNWEYHLDQAIYTAPPVENHSGAVLLSPRGELMGIGSLLVSNALGDQQRLPGNLFVPTELLPPILDELQRQGSSQASHRPWLGLQSSEQNGRLQVIRVTPGSPAQAAGLQPGDLVLGINGRTVATLEAFYKQLWSAPTAQTPIELTVLQGAELHQLTVQPVDRLDTLSKAAGI